MEKKLIVIEGLDGSGKATQTGLLFSSLQEKYGGEKGYCLRRVSFPDYGSDSSALVKMYLAGEFGAKPGDVNAYAASSFYAVDRYASFKRDWEKDWERGIILADRYTTSNAIHQCSKLPEESWDEYLEWLFHFEYALLGIPEPSMVLYLRTDPAVSQRLLTLRYEGQEKRDIHERDREYLARCQKAAAYCAEKLGWRIVECCRDGEMRSMEDIHQELLPLAGEALS